jgi:potassium-dependent mechanosensitive channel
VNAGLRWILAGALLLGAPAWAASDAVDARARALREALATPSGDERSVALQRQLLASLERRRDLARTRIELAAMAPDAAPAGVTDGMLALDDLRRRLQRLELALMHGDRRRSLLREEREAAAARLADAIAAAGRVRERGSRDSGEERLASLEAQLAQSGVEEIDALLAVLDVQQDASRSLHESIARSVAAATTTAASLERDAAVLAARFDAERERLERRLTEAAVERDAARSRLDAADALRGPRAALQRETLRESLGNRDIALELAREALSNLGVEQAAWQRALDYRRDTRAATLVASRERAAAAIGLLQRRHDFILSLRDQTLARLAEIDGRLAAMPGEEAGALSGLREALQERLQLVESAVLGQRRVLDLMQRLHREFDEEADGGSALERGAMAIAWMQAAMLRLWDRELFNVEQVLEIDGRQTTVARGVTIGKLVKAPLLLLACVLLARRLTAWIERRARRRGVDAARARMATRWVLGVLLCLGALASLALAGIPLAAFAFVGGALAIGLGFGMQSLVKNLVSGVLVLIERPFRLGDVIEVGTLRGTVVDIDLRASVLRESDGAETLIPNSLLVEQNVRNVTFRSRATRQSMQLAVAGDSDPRRVTDLLEATLARHGLVLSSPAPSVNLEQLDGDKLTFAFHYWLELEPGVDTSRVASDLRHMLHSALQEAGVRLPCASCHGAAIPVPRQWSMRDRHPRRHRHHHHVLGERHESERPVGGTAHAGAIQLAPVDMDRLCHRDRPDATDG